MLRDTLLLYIGDILAFCWLMACMLGFSFVTRHGRLANRGIFAAVQRRRYDWMQIMTAREHRIVDTQLLANISNGNAFFASTSVIVIGGLAAVLGIGEDARALLSHLPFVADAPVWMWQVKTLVLMGLFVYAFFKFAWAFRLTHYTAVMIGATPLDAAADEEACRQHGEACAKLAGISAEHANTGLRTYYFAIAGAGWYLHPLLLAFATTWVVAVLYRREYRSRSFRIIEGAGD